MPDDIRSSINDQAFSFSAPYTSALPTLFRNADNHGDTLLRPWTGMTRKPTYDEMKSFVENERPFFLFLYGDTCSKCNTIHERFANFILKSELDVYGLNAHDDPKANAMVDRLENEFPALDLGDLSVPTAYLINGDAKATFIDIVHNINVSTDFAKYLYPQINLPTVYHTTAFGGFSSLLAEQEETFVYFTPSFTEDGLLKEEDILKAKKNVAIVGTSKLDEKSVASFMTLFNVKDIESLNKKGGTVSSSQEVVTLTEGEALISSLKTYLR